MTTTSKSKAIFSHTDTSETAGQVLRRRRHCVEITKKEFCTHVDEVLLIELINAIGKPHKYYQATESSVGPCVFVDISNIDHIFKIKD